MIPKKDEVMPLSEYRPISLIGCIYKVLSNILVARLSKVLDGLISQNQSVFIGERYILDGGVILNEAIGIKGVVLLFERNALIYVNLLVILF